MLLLRKVKSLLMRGISRNDNNNSVEAQSRNNIFPKSDYLDLTALKEKLTTEYSSNSMEFGLLKKVEPILSIKDGMYQGNADHYFKVGLSAIHCIDNSISKAGNPTIKSILDMPCGYGRVLRFLQQRFRTASITGIDLIEDMVDFCVDTFNVKGVYSKKNLNDLVLMNQFDLIWCGSLITHLNSLLAVELFNFFNRHLSPGGLLIFSSHGKFVLDKIKDGCNYGLEGKTVPELIRSYEETGYGYADYPGQSNYGISVSAANWFRNQFEIFRDWKEIYFNERGWDNHHDIFCIRKGLFRSN